MKQPRVPRRKPGASSHTLTRLFLNLSKIKHSARLCLYSSSSVCIRSHRAPTLVPIYYSNVGSVTRHHHHATPCHSAPPGKMCGSAPRVAHVHNECDEVPSACSLRPCSAAAEMANTAPLADQCAPLHYAANFDERENAGLTHPYSPLIQPLYTPYTPLIHPLYTPNTPPIHPQYTTNTS